MRYIFILLVFIISCYSCNYNKKDNKVSIINHYNITIAADLSNRLDSNLYPKPVSDTSIINLIIDNIDPKILNHKRKMNQKDQFRIDFINKKNILAYQIKTTDLEIDFKKFAAQNERIQYLRTNFNRDVLNFKNEFKRINEKIGPKYYGSDIWTYFNEGIDNIIVDTVKSSTSIGNNKFLNQQKNTLIILTDGYIETSNGTSEYSLGQKKINQFRNKFVQSGENDLDKFYKKNQSEFGIKTVKNPFLKDLNVLVLELYDRTETNGGATVHPTDFEIMKLFWKDWLERSSVNKIEIHRTFSNKEEAQRIIMNFLGV